MIFNKLKIPVALIFCTLLFVGCSKKPADKTIQNNQTIKIKKHNFQGNYSDKQSIKTHYEISFDDNHQFVQVITKKTKQPIRYLQKGTYKLQKNGNIKIKVNEVTQENFENATSLNEKLSPLSIEQRKSSQLLQSEQKETVFKRKQKYFINQNNKVKFYQQKKKPFVYQSLVDQENKKYADSYGTFSGHGFTSSGMDSPMNAIAFSGNKFIWKYGLINKSEQNKDILAIFEGTYSVKEDVVTLNIQKQSNAYQGMLLTLSGYIYKNVLDPIAGKTLTLKHSNDTLSLINSPIESMSMKDLAPDDAESSYPKYDFLTQNFGVNIITNKMHQQKIRSVEELFPTGEDFKDWVMPEYGLTDPDDYHISEISKDKQPTFVGTSDVKYSGNDFIYMIGFITSKFDGSPYHGIGITKDGKIYSGSGSTFFDINQNLTDSFKEYAELRAE